MIYVEQISVCIVLAEQLAISEMTLNGTFFQQMRATKIHSLLLLVLYITTPIGILCAPGG